MLGIMLGGLMKGIEKEGLSSRRGLVLFVLW